MDSKNKPAKNYEQYGYKPDARVVISGATYNKIVTVVKAVQASNRTTSFIEMDDLNEMVDQVPVVSYNELGMATIHLLNELFSEHMKNVDLGNATPVSELTRPGLELDTVEKAK